MRLFQVWRLTRFLSSAGQFLFWVTAVFALSGSITFKDTVSNEQNREEAMFDKEKPCCFSWETCGFSLGNTSGKVFLSLAWSSMLITFENRWGASRLYSNVKHHIEMPYDQGLSINERMTIKAPPLLFVKAVFGANYPAGSSQRCPLVQVEQKPASLLTRLLRGFH